MCRLLAVIEIEQATKRVSGTEIGCGRLLAAMALLAPPQPAEAMSMEIDEPVIDSATQSPAGAAATAAAADLLQISAAAAAAAGQLRADVTAASNSFQTQTMLILCSFVWRIAVCRWPAGSHWFATTPRLLRIPAV
jgi:hypothetical protein